MHDADAGEDWLEKIELSLKVAVDHLLTAVKVAEAAVEGHLREALGDLHGAPHVLGDGGAVCLDKGRELVFLAGVEHGAPKPVDGVVILSPPAGVQRDTAIAAVHMAGEGRVRLLRSVDAVEPAEGEVAGVLRVDQVGIGDLDTIEAVLAKARDGAGSGKPGPGGVPGQVDEVVGVEVDAQFGRVFRAVVEVVGHGLNSSKAICSFLNPSSRSILPQALMIIGGPQR